MRKLVILAALVVAMTSLVFATSASAAWTHLGGDPLFQGGIKGSGQTARDDFARKITSARGTTALKRMGLNTTERKAVRHAALTGQFKQCTMHYGEHFAVMAFGVGAVLIDHDVTFADPRFKHGVKAMCMHIVIRNKSNQVIETFDLKAPFKCLNVSMHERVKHHPHSPAKPCGCTPPPPSCEQQGLVTSANGSCVKQTNTSTENCGGNTNSQTGCTTTQNNNNCSNQSTSSGSATGDNCNTTNVCSGVNNCNTTTCTQNCTPCSNCQTQPPTITSLTQPQEVERTVDPSNPSTYRICATVAVPGGKTAAVVLTSQYGTFKAAADSGNATFSNGNATWTGVTDGQTVCALYVASTEARPDEVITATVTNDAGYGSMSTKPFPIQDPPPQQ